MDKLKYLFFVSLLSVTLPGCQKDSKPTESTAPVRSENAATADTASTQIKAVEAKPALKKQSIMVSGEKLSYMPPLIAGAQIYNHAIKQTGRVTGVIVVVLHEGAQPGDVLQQYRPEKLAARTFKLSVPPKQDMVATLKALQTLAEIKDTELGVDYTPQTKETY